MRRARLRRVTGLHRARPRRARLTERIDARECQRKKELDREHDGKQRYVTSRRGIVDLGTENRALRRLQLRYEFSVSLGRRLQ